MDYSMKVLVVYATLSGSTMAAADLITATIKSAGHEVTTLTADSISADTVSPYEALIIGSPSWEDEGKDGQPLPEVRKFVESLSSASLTGKKIAVFGLGDTSYPHFCGAVDIIEEKLHAIGITPAIPSLKIDRYYSSPDNEPKVREWANTFSGVLK